MPQNETRPVTGEGLHDSISAQMAIQRPAVLPNVKVEHGEWTPSADRRRGSRNQLALVPRDRWH